MVNIRVAGCVCPPPDPVTVKEYVPGLAVPNTAIVRAEENVGVPLVGLSEGVTPAG
jgi:hypothetical protein